MVDVVAAVAADWVLFWLELPVLLMVGGFIVVMVIAARRVAPDDLPDLVHTLTSAVVAVMSFRGRWAAQAPRIRRQRRVRKGAGE